MRGRSKAGGSSGFRNVFRSKSYRRAMDAADDDWYAEQARKRREAAAQEAAAMPQVHTEKQGDAENG